MKFYGHDVYWGQPLNELSDKSSLYSILHIYSCMYMFCINLHKHEEIECFTILITMTEWEWKGWMNAKQMNNNNNKQKEGRKGGRESGRVGGREGGRKEGRKRKLPVTSLVAGCFSVVFLAPEAILGDAPGRVLLAGWS